jgi:hypothetical protein
MPIVENYYGEKVYRSLADCPTRINDKNYLPVPEELCREEIAKQVTEDEKKLIIETVQRLGIIKTCEQTNLSLMKIWATHASKASLPQLEGWREKAKIRRLREELGLDD